MTAPMSRVDPPALCRSVRATARGLVAAFVAFVALVALVAAGCGTGASGGAVSTGAETSRVVEVPEGVLAEMRASTDCDHLRHEAEVMQERIDRGSAGQIEREVLAEATDRMAELGCEPRSVVPSGPRVTPSA